MAARRKKLHELIAAKKDARTQSVETMGNLKKSFHDKAHLFTGHSKTYIPDAESGTTATEEGLELATTVPKELAWVRRFIVNAMDISLQCCLGDTHAFADVVLPDGTVLATSVPSTYLLELEDRLVELRDWAKSIPTMDSTKGFTPDPDRGEGIYKARDVVKRRTAKRQRGLVLHPPTTQHPAQTQLISEDVEVGTIRESEWSGCLTVADKSEVIARLEELLQAAKQARARANDTEVDLPKIGAVMLSYAFDGDKPAVTGVE